MADHSSSVRDPLAEDTGQPGCGDAADDMFHVKHPQEQPLSPLRKLLKGRIRAASKSWRTRKKMTAAREHQSGEA